MSKKSIHIAHSWISSTRIEGYPNKCAYLSKEYTYYFFKELDPKTEEDRKVFFKTDKGIHFFCFKKKYESPRSRWRKMNKISEQKGFIGWIPTTQKMARRIKLKMLRGYF